MKIVVMVTGLSLFALAVWAVARHFRSTGPTPAFRVLAVVTGLNIFVFARTLWLYPQSQHRLGLALALLGLSALLFIWSLRASRGAGLKLIYERDRPDHILEAGPYRYIRHPFYASYFPFWAGCAVATLHPVNIAYAVGIVIALTLAARAEERGFTTSPIAAAYEQYRARTGLFWPRLDRLIGRTL